jgi:DNA-binding CsgD family transcriptional regulator
MGVRQMTREQKQMARRLKAKGLTLKEIARDLSCSLALVTASVYVQREGVGVPDRWKPAPGHLSAEEREEILLGLGRKESMSAIARSLGRAPSTIAREVAANGGAVRYGAWRAHCRAEASSRRPKPAKLAHLEFNGKKEHDEVTGGKVAERRWTKGAMTRGAARFLGFVAWGECQSRLPHDCPAVAGTQLPVDQFVGLRCLYSLHEPAMGFVPSHLRRPVFPDQFFV